MSEYDVFENLNFLCDDVEVSEAKELGYQSADDSTDFNLSQEELATKTKEKANKKLNTRKKATTKTVEPIKKETPKAEVERPVLAGNRRRPAQRGSRCLNKSSENEAAVLAVLQATTAETVQPTTRRSRTRKSIPAAINPPARTTPSRGRGRRRNQRGNFSRQEPVSAPSNVMAAIQAALERCAAASAAGSGRAVVRSKRRLLAENAARARPVDVIDLVSSPIVPVQGFIDLDSDDEPTVQAEGSQVSSNLPKPHIAEYDEENPELEVKVMWNDKIETYKLRKYQKFVHLMQKISEAHDCPADQIVCNLDDQIILTNDTPANIDLKTYHIIYARALSDEMINTTLLDKSKAQQMANQIHLQIQSDKWKKALQVDMMKTDKFSVLYIKCAEELQLPRSSIKLTFDGDELPADETPEMFDFEGGESIDMRVID